MSATREEMRAEQERRRLETVEAEAGTGLLDQFLDRSIIARRVGDQIAAIRATTADIGERVGLVDPARAEALAMIELDALDRRAAEFEESPAGSIAGEIAAFPITSARRAVDVALGAVQGAVQPARSLTDRAGNVVAGGAGSLIGGAGVEALGRGVRATGEAIRDVAGGRGGVLRGGVPTGEPPSLEFQNLPPGLRPSVESAVRQGFRPTGAEASGSTTGRMVQEGFARSPAGMARIVTKAARNKIALNTSVGRSIGVPGQLQLTPDVIETAIQRNSAQFDEVFDAMPDIAFDATGFRLAADTIIDDPIEAPVAKGIAQRLNQKLTDEGGVLTAKEFQRFRSRMLAQSRALRSSGDSFQAAEVETLVAAFDQAFADTATETLGRPASRQLVSQFADARETFKNLVAVQRGNALDAEGNVLPARMKGNFKAVYGDQFTQRNRFPTRLGQTEDAFAFLDTATADRFKRLFPTSGTAEGNAANQLVENISRSMQSAIIPSMAASGAAMSGQDVLSALLITAGLGEVAQGVGRAAVTRPIPFTREAGQLLGRGTAGARDDR